MLVALFSAVEPASDDREVPRAFLRIAGRSVLAQQVDMALALGAERIVVVSQGLPVELVAIQHHVESQGKRFHAIAGPRALSGLISAADDLLVLADGVMPDAELLELSLGDKRGVLALPADPAVSQGFERIDRDRAWAGAMRTRGSDAVHLADLPSDVDPASSLMRLAMQAGRPITDLSPEMVATGQWMLVRSGEQAASAGRAVAAARVPRARWSAPFRALADRIVLARAERLHAPLSAARWTGFGAASLLVFAMGLAAYGHGAWALGFAGISAFLTRFSTSLSSLAGGRPKWPGRRRDVLTGSIFDLALVAILVLTTSPNALKQLLFPLAVMLGLLRLAERSERDWLHELSNDRALLFAFLTLGAAAGFLSPSIQIVGVTVLIVLLVVSFTMRLTRA